MNITKHIKNLHLENAAIPGKIYHTGLRVTEIVPYHDTGNLHEIERFCWFEYTFNHSGNGVNYRVIYYVMYDYKHDKEQKKWFEQKCTDLFELGFAYSDSGGSFSIHRVWSCYWEQVARYNKTEWAEYLDAVKEAIRDHNSFTNKDLGEPFV